MIISDRDMIDDDGGAGKMEEKVDAEGHTGVNATRRLSYRYVRYSYGRSGGACRVKYVEKHYVQVDKSPNRPKSPDPLALHSLPNHPTTPPPDPAISDWIPMLIENLCPPPPPPLLLSVG